MKGASRREEGWGFEEGVTHLVVLDGEIATLFALLVSDLHKESAHERFSDIDVVSSLIAVFFGEETDIEALHDS